MQGNKIGISITKLRVSGYDEMLIPTVNVWLEYDLYPTIMLKHGAVFCLGPGETMISNSGGYSLVGEIIPIVRRALFGDLRSVWIFKHE